MLLHTRACRPAPSANAWGISRLPGLRSGAMEATCMPRPQRSCSTRDVQQEAQGQHEYTISKRALLGAAGALGLMLQQPQQPAQALPLAPLGDIKRVGGDKLVGLSPEQVKDILSKDLSEGMYFVTGNLTKEIFADDCRFVDPTNQVTGLSKYVAALGILFDPDWSKVILKDIRVTGPSTIEADWVLGGWLRNEYFPWQAKVSPFNGHTVYRLNKEGLIQAQEQTWSISGFEALRETFTPVPGPRTQLL